MYHRGREFNINFIFQCETIVEEHEEDMIPLFKNAEANLERDICKDKIGMYNL